MAELQPPRKSVELEDPGAHELESSEGDDHFSDASEGRKTDSIVSPTADLSGNRSSSKSPVPITRVERVDDAPSHGEVPGTAAYNMRTQDAVPDEVEVVPEGTRSRTGSVMHAEDRSPTPSPVVPKTVVEKVDPENPSYGDVPGTHAYDLRKADAAPDEVVKASDVTRETLEGLPTPSNNRSPIETERSLSSSDSHPQASEAFAFGDGQPEDPWADSLGKADGGGGDDFDDFEEGGLDEEEFGDFDNPPQEPEQPVFAESKPSLDQSSHVSSSPFSSLPILNFKELDTPEKMIAATKPFIDQIFPHLKDLEPQPPDEDANSTADFPSERSQSLWTQLVTPPPLHPPDWVRSRTRRLFLVSLGVPVDLDEILPASKQKKLVLPSINVSGDPTPRSSYERTRQGKKARANQAAQSSAPTDTSSSQAEGKQAKFHISQFNTHSTRMLCSTTEAALKNFTDEELQAHIQRLNELQTEAFAALEYWLERRDSALGDKEAFEGVIENLVKHAKKSRK